MNKENLQGLDWQRWVMWLLALKLLMALAATFGEFRHPEVIRQLDTMGNALRYWLRWTVEPNLQWPLLPATLSAGDGYGIIPTEFPILNLLHAPFFALPLNIARTASWITHILMSAALTWWHYKIWKQKEVLGFKTDQAALIIPLFGTASIYGVHFMPDYVAFLLFSIAIGYSWDKPRPLVSFLLAALALLIKPPVVIAAAIFLLIPFRKQLMQAVWLVPAVVVTIAYYKGVVPFIKSLSDFPDYYAVQLRNPVTALSEFFIENPSLLARFLLRDLIRPLYFIVFLAALAIWQRPSRKFWLLTGVLLIQLIVGAALDGFHAFNHIYYFIGTSFVSALIILELVRGSKSKYVAGFVLVAFLAMNVEQGIFEFSTVIGNLKGTSWYSQCAKLKREHPSFPWNQGYHFRSEFTYEPELGICFGEIQNSKTAEFGFFRQKDTIPADCEIAAATNDLRLVKCRSAL